MSPDVHETVLKTMSPPPPVTVTVPVKIVVASRFWAKNLATVPVAEIVALAIAENVTVPLENDPAGGLVSVFIERLLLPEV